MYHLSNQKEFSCQMRRANILNSQYCSIFGREDDPNIPSKGDCRVPTSPDIKVTEDGVFKMLQALNSCKDPGRDQISPLVLRELAKPLSKPLTKFFQHSINSGVVPAQWRKAIVSPIFKKGNRTIEANYRPLSLTAFCCKLLEHIIAKNIMTHLEENNSLTICLNVSTPSVGYLVTIVSFIEL